MNIRFEDSEDKSGIRHINIEAFDSDAEANLIDALRESAIPIISLVAEENGQLVGHILFSPVTLDGNKPNISIAGLGPMAVLPDWQNQGIGSRLVEEGLKQCKRSGYEVVVVLGHPNYYPRFGFSPFSYAVLLIDTRLAAASSRFLSGTMAISMSSQPSDNAAGSTSTRLGFLITLGIV